MRKLGPVSIALCAFVSLLTAGQLQSAQSAQLTDDAGERFGDVELFAAIVHRSLDDDCDGYIALEKLATIFGWPMDAPETQERIEEYDGNGDGLVTADDLGEGIRAGVHAQVEVTMLVDANEDGELTLREHALGFPDREGVVDADGFTARQRQGFRFFDEDGNRRVTRQEITDRHQLTFLVIVWAQTIDHHMKRIDVNGDGLVRADEFAAGFGFDSAAELPAEQKAWYDIVAVEQGGSPAIVLARFRIQLLQGRPVKSRMAMERPIRPLLVPACAAQTKGDHP